ncbi:DUF4190 domain-containing protein [Streptomyces coelicoflavus]|uniref:DUF4190 domain-containing protein n=1 Tax=Streptomyces coelicoflavus TaxID=285562 RepID=UPI0036B36C79
MSIPPPPGPQGPYPQGPYAPQWGHPLGPYPRQAPLSGLAVAAFVLGVLCFVPAVGLVLGLIALARIRKRGERGKGFAVAGCVLSSVGLALWALTLSTGAVSDFWEGFRDAARGEGTAYALEKGECFTTPGGSLQGVTYDVDQVPCAAEHDGEVFAVFALPRGGSYPGDDALTSMADLRCYGLVREYAMDDWALPADVDVYYLTPTRRSWLSNDREITCLFGSTDERKNLTGSLRNDATTLDAHQIAYLEAARVLDGALESTPESEYFEEDPTAQQAWAGRVENALTEEIGMLDAHSWPSASEQPVTELVTDLEAAREEFAAAEATPDADAFYEHLYQGYALVDGDTTVTARESLGLDTTPPEYAESGGDGGESPGKEV